MRAPSQPEVFKRCRGCHTRIYRDAGKASFCADCTMQKTLRKWQSDAERQREERRTSASAIVLCEGCGAETKRGSGFVKRQFCTDCAAVDDKWKKARRTRPCLLPEVSEAKRAEAKARREADRERLEAERKAQREAERAAEQAAKPWLAPGLSVADKWRLRYRHDPEFHAVERLRSQMRRKRRGKERNIAYFMRKSVKERTKGDKWITNLLGYTAEDLRQHIERQFSRKMSWDRFVAGDIDIDHIVPASSFDLTQESEIKAAWALSNLRPMWSKDNRAKWAKREHLL